MPHSEFRKINIPLGSTIRVTRKDGSHTIYIFRGSDPQGAIFEDDGGQRHGDIGEYSTLEVETNDGWTAV